MCKILLMQVIVLHLITKGQERLLRQEFGIIAGINEHMHTVQRQVSVVIYMNMSIQMCECVCVYVWTFRFWRFIDCAKLVEFTKYELNVYIQTKCIFNHV